MRTTATFVRRLVRAVGWSVHACGLLVVGAGVALLAAAWPLGEPGGFSTIPYQRLEGTRYRDLWINPGGRASVRWGELRTRGPTGRLRTTHVYLAWGPDSLRNPGRWITVVRAETRERAAGTRLANFEYTAVGVYWGFLAAVGLGIAALPLAVRPSRVAVVGAYRRAGLASLAAARRLWALVPVRSRGSRGFEVIPR